MKRLACMALACLLLFGCAPVALPEAADPPVLATQPSAAPALEGVGLALPAPLDPLGFFADPDVYALGVEELAAKYGAAYEAVPDLYEIPDFTIGGYDARLYITVKNTKVEQVYMPFVWEDGYWDVYKSVVDALGEPDRYYRYDELNGEQQIDAEAFLGDSAHTTAQWLRDGYTYDFGQVVLGNSARPFYFAVYRERLRLADLGYYWYAGECCPHEDAGAYFDPTGIFTDASLFTSDAETVLSRYGARPASAFGRMDRFKGDPAFPEAYRLDGLSMSSCPASFHLIEAEGGWSAAYCIDVAGQSAQSVSAFFYDAVRGVEKLAGAVQTYADGEQPPSFFDENAPVDWDKPHTALQRGFRLARENGAHAISIFYERYPGGDANLYSPYERIFPPLHNVVLRVGYTAGGGN